MLYSAKLIEGRFYELRVDGVLRSSRVNLVPWRTYIPLRQEYSAFVAWHSLRRVKGQGRYLPTFQTGASYLSNHPLPLHGQEEGDATVFTKRSKQPERVM